MAKDQTAPATRNRYRLSDSAVGKIPAHHADSPSALREFPDHECVGLRLSVGKSGRRFWDFRYRFRGRKAVVRLGEWPALSTSEARRRGHDLKRLLYAGEDPKAQRAAREAMPTLAEFCDTYLAHARRTIRSASDSEQRLRLHVLPVLGTRRLDEVRKGEIQRLHSELVDRMAPASANRVLATLKALLSYAVDMEVIERSPAQGVRAHKENNARQRSLAGEELQRYLLAVAEEPNPHLRGFLLLLLATGMRRGEALTAKWEHVDITNRTLLLPQTKAGKSRTILLNDQALSIVLGLPRVAANPYLFPGHKPGTHLREPKFCHERACQRAGIGNLRIHDLRHSFASLAVSNGATLYTVQALLGHSSPTMSQRYAHLSSEVLRQGSQQVSNAIAAASPAAQNPTPTT